MLETKPNSIITKTPAMVKISNAVALGLGAGLMLGGGVEKVGMMLPMIILGAFLERPLYPLIFVGLISLGSAYAPLKDMGYSLGFSLNSSLAVALFTVAAGYAAWLGSSKITLILSAVKGSLAKWTLALLPLLYIILYLALTIILAGVSNT